MGRVSAAVLAVLALGLLPASAAGAGFSLGVDASEVTSSSALLWAHATGSGKVTLSVTRNIGTIDATGSATPKASNDMTVQFRVRHLKADTNYFYVFKQGTKTTSLGKFRTAPASNKSRTIHFAFTGDADAQRQPGKSKPYFGSFGVYSAMAKENNDFNINMGDTIYSDTEVPATGSGLVEFAGTKPASAPALTVAQKWAKYRQNLGLANLQMLRKSTGVYNHWDDHEFINDFSRNEMLRANAADGSSVSVAGSSVYGPGVKAFRDYMPVTYSSKDGIYRSFRWGKNLEMFFLDERSFRSAKAGSPSINTCDNPMTGAPDFAPTAPQNVRSEFAIISTSLSQPVSPACLAAINDPNRTLLGARQLGKFENAVKRSNATFKVVMNEVPIQQFYANPYDRWEGYAVERKTLLTFLKDNVKNLIFLSTDDHGNIVNDARFNTFPSEGGPTNSGIVDVTTGPVATGTFEREISEALMRPDGGRLADSIFLTNSPTAAPFAGVGAQCSVINTFSYGQVTVTSKKLTVELRGENRKTVREEEGKKPACPKIVVNKQ
jgi:phosphodiesterase/alkaline phosphatase D-like protein